MILLKDSDIKEVGIKFNIEPAIIKAVSIVEASGSGYYTKGAYAGKLKVRFEGHWFRRFTKGKYDKTYPHLSYKDWRLGNKYNRGLNELARFIEACNLDEEAARLSTSWGMFQIMGFNHKVCGFNSSESMVLDFNDRGEVAQLEAFLKYCESKDILDDLREGRNDVFARTYNGKDYAVNQYDTKITEFTNKYKGKL